MSKPSRRARMMNAWLRWTEKPHLARESSVLRLRRSFERKAKMSFFGPWRARYDAFSMGDTPALRVGVEGCGGGDVVLYFHGGAYVMGSPRTHRAMIAHLCKKAHVTSILLDYRKAPEHPFPAAVDDALAAYEKLLAEKTAPKQIILGGDSAGGGLALALLGEICRLGLPMPKGVFAFSPFTDMTFSGASVAENAVRDVVLPAARMQAQREMYLGAQDPNDPRASPLFADFHGSCPIWLTVGDTEILRDDTVRMAQRLEAQGADVTLEVERDLPHVWPLFHGYIPEASRTLGKLARWISSL